MKVRAPEQSGRAPSPDAGPAQHPKVCRSHEHVTSRSRHRHRIAGAACGRLRARAGEPRRGQDGQPALCVGLRHLPQEPARSCQIRRAVRDREFPERTLHGKPRNGAPHRRLSALGRSGRPDRKRAAKPRGEARAQPRDRKAAERPDSRSPAAQPEVGRPDTRRTDTRPAASDDKAAEKNTPEPGSTASAPRPQARPTERKPDAAEPTEPRAATPKPEASPPGDAQPAKGDGPN